MGFERDQLKHLVARHGKVARVVIAAIKGSSPREVGAAMLVWEGGQSGTIGGGALELKAQQQALSGDRVETHALGPELGQCCGGAVTLITEVFDADRLARIDGPIYARGPDAPPLAVSRLIAEARGQGTRPEPRLIGGWFVEPVETPQTPLWIWGAGHVGRAMVDMLHPLPEFALTWVDTAPSRFPSDVAGDVLTLPAANPALVVPHAPPEALHLILTYSHALDLELCHALLSHQFAYAGLIGSATKWARFRKRLAALGHGAAQIERITCPIGRKDLGKHPQAIAVGVAAELLERQVQQDAERVAV